MKKDVFFFNKDLIGVNNHIIRRPVEEYSEILFYVFGLYSLGVNKAIDNNSDTFKLLAKDHVVYFPDSTLSYRDYKKVLYLPSSEEMRAMLGLFECVARDVKKVERDVAISKLVESSDCFPKFALNEEYQAELESGKYLLFSLADYSEYY